MSNLNEIPIIRVANTKKEGRYEYFQAFTGCGRSYCKLCKSGQGHGPYWFIKIESPLGPTKKYIGKECKTFW